MNNPCPHFLPSRRELIAGSAAILAAGRAHAAAELPVFRVGTLPFGTVQWAVQTIIAHGYDTGAGIKVENVPLASNDAARVAFLSGSVDAIVNDLLFAARLRTEGKPVQFMPFSTKEGALVAPGASPIKTVVDLKGKSIGVAGGPLDKSWLVLRAAATKDGLDLARDARPVFGAPPLLAAKVESGELDCALLYWSYCARLQAKGFKQIVSVEQLVDELGARGKIAFVGFLFMDSTRPQILEGFSKAVRQAETLLAQHPEAWQSIRPLMAAKDEATFGVLKRAFIDGIPHKSRGEEIKDAQSFFSVVAKLGGAALVGTAAELPENLYVDQAVYG